MSAARPNDLRIERVDKPFRALLALSFRGEGGRGCLLVHTTARAVRVGVVPARPKGEAIDAQGMQLRDALEGARVAGVTCDGVEARIALRTLDGPRTLVVAHDRGALRAAIEEGAFEATIDLAALASQGEEVQRAAVRAAVHELLAPFGVAGRSALKKADRTLAAIARDAARADEADALRSDAALLLAQHPRTARGTTSVRVTDYTLTPPEERTISLDPARTAKETGDAMFHRARRLERGRAQAEVRAVIVREGREKLAALLVAMRACEDVDEAAALAARARSLGVAPQAAPGSSTPEKQAARTPHRRFIARDGTEIWVGRTAADNDALTVRLAKPHHVFVHVRGAPGSHVIVALARGASLSQDALVDAATLAAHFSSQRGQAVLEVMYAPRKYVRKPRGASVGAVMVTREKVIGLRFESDRLARLLATELGTLGARV